MEQSIWWATDGVGDGVVGGYSQDAVTEHSRMLFCQNPATQGIALNYLNGLAVTNPEWADLQVDSGGGVCYGFGYRNTSAMTLTPFTPSLGSTGWRLVLRTDWALRTVRLVLLQNSDGAASIPALTQNAGYRWELSLAHGSITVGGAIQGFTDDRTSLSSSSIVTPTEIQDRTREFSLCPHSGRQLTGGGADLIRADGRGLAFPDNEHSVAFHWFTVPADFASTLVVTAILISGGAGDCFCNQSSANGVCGGDYEANTDFTGGLTVPVLASPIYSCIADLAIPSAVAGDHVVIEFHRDATNILDTIGNLVHFAGWRVRYLADS